MAGLRNGDKNELQQGRWEPAAPSLSSPHSTFMVPERPGYTSAEVACTQAAGSAAAPGGALLNFARMGFLGMLENNAESSMFEILSQPLDVGVQQSRHYKQHGGEPERRHINSATPPPQPPRRANQPAYGCTPAGRQLSRSVPSSPTFATNRLHMSTAIRGGGDMSGASTPPAGRAGNGLPVLSTSLSAHVNSSQQASSTSASVLTTSPDLASCTSNLVPPSPGSVRSAGFGCDHAAAATASSFCNDHAAKSASISTNPSASTPRTASSIINNEHAARSGAYSSDQVRPANFSSDQASRSANFSDLAAAASLFLPSCFPSTPASSTSSQNPATAAPDQRDDHQVLQGAAGSCTANINVQGVAKKRRLQGAGGEGCSKAASGGDEADYGGGPDIFASLLPLSSTAAEGDTNADIVPIASEMSNNSANIEGEESAMKCSNSTTSTSKCMKTQVCEGPPPPKQDYIHVRARRGQATDSHSLAERVRREKISERMRFLQDLVPGCNKITGKAVMLDEIINYVQSLQRQVEFLSMKLSAVSPQSNRFETNHFVKQVDPKSMQMGTTLQFNQTEHHHHQHDLQLSMPLLLDAKQQQAGPQLQLQLPSTMGAPQAWEDELQSLVQMGFPSLP